MVTRAAFSSWREVNDSSSAASRGCRGGVFIAKMTTGYIAHHIPGRMRIRIPSAKGDAELSQRIRELAKSLAGVESVESNFMTGSLLIHYAKDGFGDFERRLSSASDSVLDLKSAPPEPKENTTQAAGERQAASAAAAAIAAAFKELDGNLRSATGNTLDLKVLLPLGAAAAGLLTLRKAMPTPLWVTLMIFAFSAFVILNPGIQPEGSGGQVSEKPG